MAATSGSVRAALGAALAAALLFGAAAPLLKPVVAQVPPLLMAGLLYLGAGVAMLPAGRRRGTPPPLDRVNARRLAGAVMTGGVVAPVLLAVALRLTTASAVALLLSFEVAATALLGAALFHDVLGRRGWIGIGLAVAAGMLLASGGGVLGILAASAVVLACFLWGFDNHLTSLIDTLPPARTTMVKCLAASAVNLALGAWLTPTWPTAGALARILMVGAACYGVSIALYIGAAQRLGAVRAQAAFATAPFWGVALATVLLGERLRGNALVAMALAGAAVVLILRDQHAHPHRHAATEHEHRHRHDDAHHDHPHPELASDAEHVHRHSHDAVEHTHRHIPDLHHRHSH